MENEYLEVWKSIQDYEGLYEVSNLGRVRSLNYGRMGKTKILKAVKSTWGYLKVHLWKDKKPKTFLIHRLVAQAFIPNPQNLPEVNHKDENKENNRVKNLEWCNEKYNTNYGTRNQIVAEKMTNGKLSKTVISTDKNGVEEYFPSIREAERRYGFKNGGIQMCLKNKIKTYKGRTWRYADAKDLDAVRDYLNNNPQALSYYNDKYGHQYTEGRWFNVKEKSEIYNELRAHGKIN